LKEKVNRGTSKPFGQENRK